MTAFSSSLRHSFLHCLSTTSNTDFSEFPEGISSIFFLLQQGEGISVNSAIVTFLSINFTSSCRNEWWAEKLMFTTMALF